MSIWGNPVMIGSSGGGSGGGGSIDRTLQNSLLNRAVYTKGGFIGGFNQRESYWQPYNSDGSALVVDWRQPFAIHLKFKLSALDTSRSQAILGCMGSSAYFYVPITMELQGSGGQWWMAVSTDGSSWTNQTSIPFSAIPHSTTAMYTFDIIYDGTDVTFVLFDGTNTETKKVTPSSSLYYSSSYYLAFGNIAQSNTLYSRYVYFDPNDCYIESSGVMVWGSRSNGEVRE